MGKTREIFKKKLAYVSGGLISETLPKGKISQINIIGTTVTDCTGTLVANAAISWIKLRIGSKEFFDLDGDQIDGAVPYSIQLFREFFRQKHHVDMPDNSLIIKLPDALPANVQVSIIIKWNTYTAAGCTADDLTYYIDITYELEDKIKGKVVVPKIIWEKKAIGILTKHQYHYVVALEYRLRATIFLVEDDGTLSATPKADIESMIIKTPGEPIFDGDMAELKAQHESKSRFALTAGFWIIAYKGGRKVPPNSLLYDFFVETAGTNINVHMLHICY